MAGEIRLYSGYEKPYTCISNEFIDCYMPQANGEFVKVYLQLLRSLQHPQDKESITSVADIADRFNNTENDVLRALRYWEKTGLLALDYTEAGALCGICLQPDVKKDSGSAQGLGPLPDRGLAGKPADPEAPAASFSLSARQPKHYTAAEISRFSENPDIQELFFIIQTYIQHPLTENDTNTILFWFDDLEFRTDLIEYLVEYCITKGHYSTAYMNKVALSWAQNGISTVEEARENAAIHSQVYYAVMKSLGIHGRNLVPAENEFIRKWTKDYGFSQEMIEEACARTMTATHQPSFEYTDTILTRWHKENVHTREEAAQADEAFNQKRRQNAAQAASAQQKSRPANNKFNNFTQRSYNEDDLEKMLLNRPVQ